MEKVRTQIPGLDTLLHGGVQLYTNTENCRTGIGNDDSSAQSDPDSLVIVVKGAKGVYKTSLAMHLMQGLTVSLRNYGQRPGNGKALFYSINKSKNDLNDSYLDMIIGQFLQRVVTDYRKEQFNKRSECGDITDRNIIDGILSFMFDFDNQSRDDMTRFKTQQRSPYVRSNITRMICEGAVNYNMRTNSLHFVRNYPGDDNLNLVATRRHDSIEKYLEKLRNGKNDTIRTSKSPIAEYFVNSLVNLHINDFETDDCDPENIRKFSAIDKFKEIENIIYEKWYRECHESGHRHSGNARGDREHNSECDSRRKDKDQPYDCVVIDGFSQLSDTELTDIPYGYLTEHLRKFAKITILVFDDREAARCDGDIVIEMKEDYDNDEAYMLHQLRIAKSIFQTVILGWHQYKKRDFGIEVFPSQHMQLSKRYYIQNKSKHIGQSLFDSSINEYLDAKNYRDCLKGNVDDCPSKLSFEHYLNRNRHMADCLQDKIFMQYAMAIDGLKSGIVRDQKNKDKGKTGIRNIFEDILMFNYPDDNDERTQKECGNCNQDNDCDIYDRIETDHFPSTVIIGNPNSYKRTFALATAYSLACRKRPVHTLFFLFDKNELDMRTRMVCPAFYGNSACERLPKCRKCAGFIHTYNMRMGCISPNEFFSILLEQINFYCDTSDRTGNEHTWMHIVLDDIQKIQFSFPFLHNTKLFLSALMDICRQNKVKLTILCDKNSELTHEISSIADNVIAIRRDKENIYDIRFYIEHRLREKVPSRIVRLDIRDILHLFRCNDGDMHIAFSTEEDEKDTSGKSIYNEFFNPVSESDRENNIQSRVTPEIIGSMKEYWRKTENVVLQDQRETTESSADTCS